jgi:hypothetical protein
MFFRTYRHRKGQSFGEFALVLSFWAAGLSAASHYALKEVNKVNDKIQKEAFDSPEEGTSGNEPPQNEQTSYTVGQSNVNKKIGNGKSEVHEHEYKDSWESY